MNNVEGSADAVGDAVTRGTNGSAETAGDLLKEVGDAVQSLLGG